MLNGREAAAKRSLIRIRKSNALDVLQELHEMKTYARHHGLVAAVADNDARHHALRRSAGRIGGAEASTVAPDVEAPTKLSNICACGLGSEGGALSSVEQRGVVVAVLLFVFQRNLRWDSNPGCVHSHPTTVVRIPAWQSCRVSTPSSTMRPKSSRTAR
eukprot:7333926-Prymnesium_polylepis.2